ncbi:nicotinate-nucleotide adenylyltransferase [Roseibium suaedae]|uniref:Probable nicotinate-nucleotide adenylyltransferase n=1 Tax=Roseibium suaedae TaxID=735517 RepID=A0A1M6ZLS8_9HYPH|nr:nicotinate-nucleotide adenylyltransferase [Roseibium suaedae]SHL31313.1 nicotinate-nucleotide adenylyltransferase [Roseibium suaedae]
MTEDKAFSTVLPDWLKLPHAERGNRIGLFGGSFNPPHSGHQLVAETAMKRLDLDQVWWLVSPGNPLKDHSELEPQEQRIRNVERLSDHPGMRVTGHEAVLGTSYTAETLACILARRPGVRFVWIMGADNLASFHRWQNWRSIASAVPIAVVDRPGASLSVMSAPFARVFARHRIDETDAVTLPGLKPPAWVFLRTRLDAASSTNLRKLRRK